MAERAVSIEDVITNTDGIKYINSLLKTINEQDEEIDFLKEKIDELQNSAAREIVKRGAEGR